MAGHRDPVLLQHLSDLACGLTRPVEDLPVGEPDSGTAIGGGVEIPFEIRIAPGRRIMVHAAVELDDEPFAVLGIAVAHVERRRGGQRHSEACGQPAECRAGYGLAGGAVVVVTGAVVVVVVGAVVVVVVSVVVVSVVVGVVSSTVVVVGTTVSVTVCVGAGTTGADVATDVVVVVVVDVVVVVVVEGESDENSCTRA